MTFCFYLNISKRGDNDDDMNMDLDDVADSGKKRSVFIKKTVKGGKNGARRSIFLFVVYTAVLTIGRCMSWLTSRWLVYPFASRR